MITKNHWGIFTERKVAKASLFASFAGLVIFAATFIMAPYLALEASAESVNTSIRWSKVFLELGTEDDIEFNNGDPITPTAANGSNYGTIPVTGNCLGYRMVDHQFLIDEEEEQIVLRIFSMYLSGMGVTAIAKQLTKDGIKTRNGKDIWSPRSVYCIIRNEKYQGDISLGKKYVTDHISKKEVDNHGERPMYYVQNAHDPIIDKDEFTKVQQEIAERAKAFKGSGEQMHHEFVGLLRCGQCGNPYKHKYNAAGTKYQKSVWICRKYDLLGKEFCDSQQIPDDILKQKTCEVLGISNFDEQVLRERVESIIIPKRNTIIYVLKDGTEKQIEWQHRSRRESWTQEMRERARIIAYQQWQQKKEEG